MSRHLPSPGTVIACIALVIACAGSATAATLLTGKQIKDGSLTGKDVKDKSLTSKDFKGSLKGAKGDKGDKGDPGTAGAKGDKGDKGDAGSDASVNGVAAGGDLAGTYPNPSIAAGAVTPDKLGAAPAARGEASANQDIASDTETLQNVNFATEVFDNAGMFDPDTGTITAPRAGLYSVSAGIRWSNEATGMRQLSIMLNTTTPIAGDTIVGDSLYFTDSSASTLVRLVAGDTIKVRVRQNSNDNPLAILGSNRVTHLAAAWVSP